MSIKIGLLGFGTVASGIPFLLKENGEKVFAASRDQLEIAKVLVKDDEEKDRLIAAGNDYNFVTNVDEILNDEEIQIVVELMGRIEPARTFITKALEAGKNVVSANKDLIATHGKELIALAQDKGVAFYYEAAVAGGIPILRTLANSLTSDKVTRILGVLNGTSNFMMTKMVDEGWSYEDALKTAQELGYAESDPTNDVEGYDAAYKAVILSQFGFGATIDFDDVSHKGITNISTDDVAVAQELGYVIKLVGDVREVESGISAEVSPTFLPKNHPLASVNDVMNAVFVESIGIGESMYYGPGAVKNQQQHLFWQTLSVLLVVFQMAMWVNHLMSSIVTCHWLIQRTLRAITTLPLIRQMKKVKSFTCLKSSTQKIFHLNKSCNKKQMAQQLVSL